MTPRWVLAALCGVAVAATSSSSFAQDDLQAPLRLEDVLDAAARTHPDVEVADRGIDRARAKRLSAQGGWDPYLGLYGKLQPVGYYRKGQIDAVITQATPLWGIGLYAGYRLGEGNFEIYKGDDETLSFGEVRAGISVPVWKNGPIDERRAKIQTTNLKAQAAECEQRSTWLKVGKEAAKAYWKWVASGQEVRIQRELLAVAQARDSGLREQAGLGSIPPITVVDNERLVLDRQSKLVKAEQSFRAASLALSLYLRDDEKTPIVADEGQVVANIELVPADLPDEESDIRQAYDRRPELCKLQRKQDIAEVELRLAKNQRAPEVNVRSYVARDFGSGPVELEPLEFGVGIDVSMPLLLRKARGDFKAAQAELSAVSAELRGLRDRVAAEVRQARVDLEAARQQIRLAQRQVDVARRLAEAERDKLLEGASNLVILNLRELAAAEAATLEVEAKAAYQRAYAEYLTVSGVGL